MMEIRELSEPSEWNRFVDARASLHHSWCWEWRTIIASAFGHEPHYLGAFRGNECVGILPLFFIKSVLFGKALVSVPYLNGGGILTDDVDAGRALLQRAEELRNELGCRYLELRQLGEIPFLGHLEVRTHKASMLLPLKSDPELLFNSFNKKLRSQIRRPEKDGVTADSGPATADRVSEFYSVYSKNMRDLGTPVFTKRFPELTAEHFRDRCRLTIARHEGKIIGAGFVVITGGLAEIPWASTLREFNHLSANMALYWQVIKDCCFLNAESFDFGRSSLDSGTYRFKAQWGANSRPLYWYYTGEAPNITPTNSTFSLPIKIWRQLPVTLTNVIGPIVARSIP